MIITFKYFTQIPLNKGNRRDKKTSNMENIYNTSLFTLRP